MAHKGRRLGCVGWGVIAYLAFAAYAWFDFTRINHDGLANVGKAANAGLPARLVSRSIARCSLLASASCAEWNRATAWTVSSTCAGTASLIC